MMMPFCLINTEYQQAFFKTSAKLLKTEGVKLPESVFDFYYRQIAYMKISQIALRL